MKKIFGFIAFIMLCVVYSCNKPSVTIINENIIDTVNINYCTGHKWEVYAITDDEQELCLMDTVSNMYVETVETGGLYYMYMYYKTNSYPSIEYCFRYEDVSERFTQYKFDAVGELDNYVDGKFFNTDSVKIEFDKTSNFIFIGKETIKSDFKLTFQNDTQLLFKIIK